MRSVDLWVEVYKACYSMTLLLTPMSVALVVVGR